MLTDTITLYNHYKGHWMRTVLKGVQWTEKVTKTVDSSGVLHATPEVSITVPFRPGYVSPKLYRGEGFTFGLGNLDVVVLGECVMEISDTYTISDLQAEYPSSATIYAVKDNTIRTYLKHWKVAAK